MKDQTVPPAAPDINQLRQTVTYFERCEKDNRVLYTRLRGAREALALATGVLFVGVVYGDVRNENAISRKIIGASREVKRVRVRDLGFTLADASSVTVAITLATGTVKIDVAVGVTMNVSVDDVENESRNGYRFCVFKNREDARRWAETA